MTSEQILTLGIALGSGILACALARRMTGQLLGYVVYTGIQITGMVSGLLYLYLVR